MMGRQNQQGQAGNGPGWLALAGAGVLGGFWVVRKLSKRTPGAVGAHAWVVPMRQAHAEAQWTRQALVHASESKHG